jgi:hypothetical protein
VSWREIKDYDIEEDLVQVLCEVTEPVFRSNLARACECPVSSGDHAVGDTFVSIGFRDDVGGWQVAGWDMTQDFWAGARCFRVIKYQRLAYK